MSTSRFREDLTGEKDHRCGNESGLEGRALLAVQVLLADAP
jgi:hypothetical protein